MADKHLRKQIVFRDTEQKEYVEEFVRTQNFPSFSHFCRHAMDQFIKRQTNESSKDKSEIMESMSIFHDSLFKKLDDVETRQELMEMKIERDGLTDDIGPALGDISRLLLKRDMAHREILAKARKYNESTKLTVLNYMHQANFAGHMKNIDRKKIEKQEI